MSSMTAPSGYVLEPLREDADLPSMRISREQTAQAFDVEPRQVQMVSLASKTWAREPVPAKLGTPRLLLFCVVLFFFTISPVDALITTRQISQYGHTACRAEYGVFSGVTNSIDLTA